MLKFSKYSSFFFKKKGIGHNLTKFIKISMFESLKNFISFFKKIIIKKIGILKILTGFNEKL
jgi:hypothetical protein